MKKIAFLMAFTVILLVGCSKNNTDNTPNIWDLIEHDFISFRSNVGNGNFTALQDGNMDTRWTSGRAQEAGHYLIIEFPSVVEYNYIVLETGSSRSDYPRGLAISTSQDGETWAVSDIISNENNTHFHFESESYRFLRLEVTESSGRAWWSIHELSFGNSEKNEIYAEKINDIIFSSNIKSNFVALTDGNAETRWTSGRRQEVGDFLMLEFAEAVDYNIINLENSNSSNDTPQGLAILTSLNGEDWYVTEITENIGNTDFKFVSEPYLFLRLEITALTGERWWWTIHELNLGSG
jgi:hypothetical protein